MEELNPLKLELAQHLYEVSMKGVGVPTTPGPFSD